MTADVLRSPRRGTSSGMRHKAYALDTAHQRRLIRGRVLRSVRRPVHVNPHYTPRRKLRWWGDGPASRLGNPRKRQEPTLGSVRTDVVRLAACHRFRIGRGVMRREKEGDRGLRPCEDQELGSGCSHVVVVAEVGRRRLVSNRLGKRAPKRAVRVE